MEGTGVHVEPSHLGRNVRDQPLQCTSGFLMEQLCSSRTSHLKPRDLFIEALIFIKVSKDTSLEQEFQSKKTI